MAGSSGANPRVVSLPQRRSIYRLSLLYVGGVITAVAGEGVYATVEVFTGDGSIVAVFVSAVAGGVFGIRYNVTLSDAQQHVVSSMSSSEVWSSGSLAADLWIAPGYEVRITIYAQAFEVLVATIYTAR